MTHSIPNLSHLTMCLWYDHHWAMMIITMTTKQKPSMMVMIMTMMIRTKQKSSIPDPSRSRHPCASDPDSPFFHSSICLLPAPGGEWSEVNEKNFQKK